MTRKFKTLGLSLIAVFALGAVMASSAFAADATITSTNGVYPVNLHGEQTGQHKFTVGGNSVECETATFSGTLTKASSEVTVTPFYGNPGTCKAFGISGASVTTGNCDYTFKSVGGEESGATKATVDIACSSGEMTIDTPLSVCTIHVKAQNGLGHVSFANNGKHVDVTADVKGIHAQVTGFFCPTSAGTYNNATYTGSVTLKGSGEGVDGIDAS